LIVSVRPKAVSIVEQECFTMPIQALIPNPNTADGQEVDRVVPLTLETFEFTDLKSAVARTAPHGLGHVPIIIATRLVCVSDDDNTGMTTGQKINLGAHFDVTNNLEGFSIGCDETNFYVTFIQALSHWLLKRHIDGKLKIDFTDTRINYGGSNPKIDITRYKVVINYM
jgi:hypothetical protein